VPARDPASLPSPLDRTGERLRERRQELGMSARELARRVSLSPSLISQIERGSSVPSVATLYAIVSELGLSLDQLFSLDGNGHAAPPPVAPRPNPVVREEERESLKLASGVHWQRLTPQTDPRADFHFLIYEPGGASCEEGVLVRHSGHEYGHVISGRLAVTIGFDVYRLGPGDSVSFESAQPHRLATIGDEPVHAVWVVVGRLEPYGTFDSAGMADSSASSTSGPTS
jgi:transcriptional regulator with XRE-family HTH domain